VSRWVLRLYPPSFRARYAVELEALVEDLGGSHAEDLLRGAARAWLRPSFTGPDAGRRRRQATVSTVWVAWCAGFLVAPAVDRVLLDPPVADAPRALLAAGQVLFFAGWALALAGALPLVVRSLLPALRARDWHAVRPLVPALVLAVLTAAGFAAVADAVRGAPPHGDGSSALVVGLVLSLVLLAGFVAAAGLGPAAALERLTPDVRVLQLSMVFAVPLAALLAALAAVSLAAVAAAGWSLEGAGVVLVPTALGVASCAALVAVVSGVRGLLART
jgi:hypothetical protein